MTKHDDKENVFTGKPPEEWVEGQKPQNEYKENIKKIFGKNAESVEMLESREIPMSDKEIINFWQKYSWGYNECAEDEPPKEFLEDLETITSSNRQQYIDNLIEWAKGLEHEETCTQDPKTGKCRCLKGQIVTKLEGEK
jgi:hypothetical protein